MQNSATWALISPWRPGTHSVPFRWPLGGAFLSFIVRLRSVPGTCRMLTLTTLTAALAFRTPPSLHDCATAAVALTFTFGVAAPAFAADVAAGESVFRGNCAACHVGGQNVIRPERTLEQDALEEYLDGGANVSRTATRTIHAHLPTIHAHSPSIRAHPRTGGCRHLPSDQREECNASFRPTALR